MKVDFQFKNIILLILFNLFLIHTIHSQTMRQLEAQAVNEYREIDEELNIAYKKILLMYDDDYEFIEALRSSQRNWIKFRDSEVKMKYPKEDRLYYGSSYRMCVNYYLAELTSKRIKTLNQWIDGTEEGDVCSGSIRISSLNNQNIDNPFADYSFTPPPPAPPQEIELIEDEELIEEDIVEISDPELEQEVVEVEDIEVEEFEEDVEVPFAVVEDAPIFLGCEKEKNNEARKKCMSQKISRHVNRKFDIGLAEELGLSGRLRISVIFKINKNGDIVEVRSRAPHPRLEKEAAKVIKSLPKMKPGRQKGKPVTVQYALPLSFVIQ